MTDWAASSWRQRPALQQPDYPDPAALEAVLGRVRGLPPLVVSGEVERLREELAEAAHGRRFVLQGGDCAERFQDVTAPAIVRKLKILLQMGLVIAWGARRPVVRIGRMAGQFAKPRSRPTEHVAGRELPSYRGDIVNGPEPDETRRRPDPERVLASYFHAASMLNFVRALLDGGFADLHHPEHWQLDFMADARRRADYQAIADRIRDAIEFVDSLGGLAEGVVRSIPLYTSHEGLLLPYEEAMTQQPPRRARHYNLGAHFLWIGDRTRQPDGAHVEYFRGIANPIGVKVGPGCTTDDLARLVERLDPRREPGRLTLITRYGKAHVQQHLPMHIRTLKSSGHAVVWSCDPMHGNGTLTPGGVKTRDFDAILSELTQAFEIHRAEGGHLAGVHFELTGDDVTECIGGPQRIREEDLTRAYETGCDPRLNYGQSLEMAFHIARMLT
jgi:3-deoxy-7-phosphoheptulonate synthase